MNKIIGRIIVLGGIFFMPLLASATSCGPQTEGPCVECGPHTNAWTLDYCPSLSNSPSVTPTTFCNKVGAAPSVPTVVAPIYQAGQKETHTDYDCTNTTYQYAGISYTVSGVLWDPPLPANFAEQDVPSFTSQAYVNVTSSDTADCSSPGRVNIGSTVTWNIASGIKNTASISLPNIDRFNDWVDGILDDSPSFIKDVTLTINGTVSKETGQTCCSSVPTDGPSNYTKYTGSVNAGLNVTLVVPGSSWIGSYYGETPIEYYLAWNVTLGPTLTITPGGTASASGTLYDNPNCGGCIETSFSGNCAIKFTYGVSASATGRLFESGHWYTIDGTASLSIVGSATVSASGAIKYDDGATCPNQGLYGGSFSIGSADVGVTATATIDGYGFSFEKSLHLFDGWSD